MNCVTSSAGSGGILEIWKWPQRSDFCWNCSSGGGCIGRSSVGLSSGGGCIGRSSVGLSSGGGCIGLSSVGGCIGLSSDGGCIGLSSGGGCIGLSSVGGCIGLSSGGGCIGLSSVGCCIGRSVGLSSGLLSIVVFGWMAGWSTLEIGWGTSETRFSAKEAPDAGLCIGAASGTGFKTARDSTTNFSTQSSYSIGCSQR